MAVNRSGGEQALFQLAGLGTSIFIGLLVHCWLGAARTENPVNVVLSCCDTGGSCSRRHSAPEDLPSSEAILLR